MKMTVYIETAVFAGMLKGFYDNVVMLTVGGGNDVVMHDQMTAVTLKFADYKVNEQGRRINLTKEELAQIKSFPITSYRVHRKILMKQLNFLAGLIEVTFDSEDDYVKAETKQYQRQIALTSITNHSNAGVFGNPTKEWNLSRVLSIFFGND